MGKAIRKHIGKGNAKQTYCGIVINKTLPMVNKGENFFESENKPVRLDCICKNCVSLFAKSNVIYRNYIEKVKANEAIVKYEDNLPKSIRAMKYYCAKRQLNWNNKNTKPIDKLQAKTKPAIEKNQEQIAIERIEKNFVNSDKEAIERITSIIKDTKDEIIELTEEIAIPGEKSIKGKARELRKQGLLPVTMNWKHIPETIDRIEDGHPIAIVKGFNNSWKVIEEFCSINNCNNSNVKELTGWVDFQLARKVYNQAIINRVFTE